MKKNITRLIILVLVFTLCINFVWASPVERVFEALGDLNIAENYQEYYIGIDFIIYLLIFGGVLNATASHKFGKPATVGLALALSITMVVFESREGFAIGDFWYIGVFALLAVFLGLIYSKLKGVKEKHTWTIISIGYIVFYIILTEFIKNSRSYFLLDYPWLHFLLIIALIAAILKIVWDIIPLFKTK